MQLRRALQTGIAGFAALYAFDALWVLVVERALEPGYWLVIAIALLIPLLVLSVAFSFTRNPPPWILTGSVALVAGLIWGPGYAAATAIVVGAFCFGLLRTPPADPALYGVTAAACAVASTIVVPFLADRVPNVLPYTPTETDIGLASVGVPALLLGLLVLVRAHPTATGRFDGRVRSRMLLALCLLGLASCLVLRAITTEPRARFAGRTAAASEARPGAPSRPHVLVWVLDTVRADHLGVYDYARPTTPRLERFLSEHPRAQVHRAFYANSNWTVPSHASLLTGWIPSRHGAHFVPESRSRFAVADGTSLADALRAVGYETFGVAANPWLLRVEGMDRGFELFDTPDTPAFAPFIGEAARRAFAPGIWSEAYTRFIPRGGEILAALTNELRTCGDRPCFGFANLFDAHAPYVPERCRGRFVPWSWREPVGHLSIHDPPAQTERLMSRYDEAICDLDEIVVEALERLERDGLLPNSWVFITSDHGEAFGEHGITEHGSSLYNDQVEIPLIVIPPAQTRVALDPAPASLIDLATTIAAIAGSEPVGQGRDLRRSRDDSAAGTAAAEIEFFGDASKARRHNPRAGEPARAVVANGHKLIEQGDRRELYDLSRDPTERDDLAAERPGLVERLAARLPPLDQDALVDATPPAELSAEELRQLRELGYAQ